MTRALLVAILVLVGATAGSAADKVTVLKTPNGGIQPQAVSDAKGTLHLIYFKGDAGAGDLFYVRQEAGKGSSPPRSGSTASREVPSQPAPSAAARSPWARKAVSTSPGTARARPRGRVECCTPG